MHATVRQRPTPWTCSVPFLQVLITAADLGADAVLLGGDLFHENKPSRSTLVKAIQVRAWGGGRCQEHEAKTSSDSHTDADHHASLPQRQARAVPDPERPVAELCRRVRAARGLEHGVRD